LRPAIFHGRIRTPLDADEPANEAKSMAVAAWPYLRSRLLYRFPHLSGVLKRRVDGAMKIC
jgi:hypothetical protein